MLNTKLEDYISKECPSNLILWMQENPQLIYHSVDSLMKKMRSLELCDGKRYTKDAIDINGCIELLKALFIDKEKVSEIEFNLLEAAAYSIFVKSNDMLNAMGGLPELMSIYLIFIDTSDLVNYKCIIHKDYLPTLYNAILDVYIPTDNPNAITCAFSDYFSIQEILQNAYNTKWFSEKYNSCEIGYNVSYKDCLLLFKYISDIYSNKEQKLDFFFKLHQYFKGPYSYNASFYEISDRYEKYFGNDTRYLITEVMSLLSSNTLSDDITKFLIKWSTSYGKTVKVEVMKCFINDISYLMRYTSFNNGDINTVKNSIADAWGTDDYIVLDPIKSDELTENDKPISYLLSLNDEIIATEAAGKKASAAMNSVNKKIYKAFRTYKGAEEKVDSQMTKAISTMKKAIDGDVREEIIEGKKFTAIGLLKQFLRTVGLFSIGPIKATCALVIKYALKKKTKVSERRKILMELETEIEMITEKIEDARGDGNREAKYSMMRTKKELENAYKRIQYGLEADEKSLSSARKILDGNKKD